MSISSASFFPRLMFVIVISYFMSGLSKNQEAGFVFPKTQNFGKTGTLAQNETSTTIENVQRHF
jgi:hypothetical protein